jgi:hypothetical protein
MKRLLFVILMVCVQYVVFGQKQTNVTGKDVIADAPWRMKKTDGSGNINGIPVNVLIKDADGTGVYANLIYLNVYIKNAKDTSFGSPVIFNTYTDSAFLSLFSAKSVTDAALDVQSFDASLPVKDPNYTIQFTSDNSWLDGDYTKVNHKFWYFTITIPPEKLTGFDDIIDIKVYFSLGELEADDQLYFRVFRYNDAFPELTGWYRGDSHYHTMYTNNTAEYGLPLSTTKEIAKIVGLDWITSTNHSCDYDEYGTSPQSNWSRENNEIQTLNANDNSMIFIHGMEASVKNSAGNLIHLLSYPNSVAPYSMPYVGDGNGDLTATSVTIDALRDSLTKYGGFAYSAHPFATGDQLSSLISGGIWNVGDTAFPANGTAMAGYGTVVCNNTSITSDLYSTNSTQELFKSKIKGGEIWNYKNSLTTTDQSFNAWNVTYDSGISALTPYDITDTYSHYNRLLPGLEVDKFILKKGLKLKNSNNNISNYRYIITAGSDAHGDYNYSNTSFVFGVTGDISDATIGNPSMLVYCPSGMGNDGSNVLSSLENGNVIISDGPIVSIGISTDGNNNTNEYIIGQEAIPNTTEYSNAKIKFDVVTTEEFGKIKTLKFITGTQNGEHILVISIDSTVLNQSHVYSLDSLIQQTLAGDSINENDYFYVRAELTTYKNYGTLKTIYKRPSETFRSYTNPIWIKKPSGIITVSDDIIDPDICNVYPNPFYNSVQIHFENLNSENVKVELFNMFGTLVQSKDYGNSQKNSDYIMGTNNLSQGYYLLKVIAGKKIYHYKLFKTSGGEKK